MARPTQDRTEVILTAARAQFRAVGAEGATVDDIAARAGVGKGTVFLYWPSKARLYEAVVGLEVAQTLASLTTGLRRNELRLSLGTIARHEIAASLGRPSTAPLLVDQLTEVPALATAPRRALRRIIEVLRSYGLVVDLDAGDIIAGMEVAMTGALVRGLGEPQQRDTILTALDHLVSSAYDRPGAAADAAIPEALEALEDAIDAIVAAAAPDRPTTARLRPHERPA
ncbi:TetR/AcrR family transcriptional regulator [Paractinoplanes lichenicola]|uniref:TetR/AcrR family transcriptional regulator n=1 Tax=Paractinoplanes lichenicola TaxID=2802976 RepID=A0ABS1W036_9ACTN|nr:TetR/AcrR family transcriptional regulator [Actinoplanes lichenicola]MBL7260101.1 TetR/AcrR family transcriptional regulator [Actinoplanes lichenicola]